MADARDNFAAMVQGRRREAQGSSLGLVRTPKLWEARSLLDRGRFLQGNARFAAFSDNTSSYKYAFASLKAQHVRNILSTKFANAAGIFASVYYFSDKLICWFLRRS